MEDLLEKYKKKLKDFEYLKPGFEEQLLLNEDGMAMCNSYYMLLTEIVLDLKQHKI